MSDLTAAWAEHRATTGHTEGLTERLTGFDHVVCLECRWFAIEERPAAAGKGMRDEDFDPPSMTRWQRDLEADHVQDLVAE